MSRIKIAAALILLALIFVVIFTAPGFFWDIACWKEWAIHIKQQGLRNAYKSTTDYLPLYQYELWLYGKIMGTEQAIDRNIALLKIVTLFFDVVGLWFVYKWIDKKVDFLLVFIFCAINAGYLYNSIIWGQVDGIFATLIFISLYYGHNNQTLLSAVFFLLVLNFKLQAIVFLPVWGLLCLNNMVSKPDVKNILLPVLAMVLLECLILFPFFLSGDSGEVLRVVRQSVGKYPLITIGAKNIWSFVLDGHTDHVPDTGVWFGGVTYNKAGLYMFFIASFIALLPLINISLKNMKNRTGEPYKIAKERLWLICALVITCFYFFNTQMHDRYAHPAFIFIIAYAFYTRNVFPLILFSVAYFLTLEDFLHYLKLPNYKTLIFDDMFIAGLYAILIGYLFVKLFSRPPAGKGYNNLTA